MKVRGGFVSNSSSSSFIITDMSYDIVTVMELSVCSENEGYTSPERWKLFQAISKEVGYSPHQNEEKHITTKDIPKLWDTNRGVIRKESIIRLLYEIDSFYTPAKVIARLIKDKKWTEEVIKRL